MIRDLQKDINFIGIIGLCISVGLGFFMEFFYHESPCALCFLQRGMMIGTAVGFYMNLVRGIHIKHYALSLLWVFFGLLCSLRHMGLNVCQKLAVPPFLFLSHRIYFWAFIVFCSALCGIVLLLFLYKPLKESKSASRVPKLVSGGLLLMTLLFATFSILLRRGFTF